MSERTSRAMTLITLACSASLSALVSGADVEVTARNILNTTGVKGGLVVHVGCGDGALTAALCASDAYCVHGLDRDAARVAAARRHVRSLGKYGQVSIDRLEGDTLPYVDGLVNLVVLERPVGVEAAEVMRVLCPGGVLYSKQNGLWEKTVKPISSDLDEWTHYLHDASNNAVSHDRVVGPPQRLQWVGSPKFTRHHDRMSSLSAAVSTGGRVFYIFDEASSASILIPPKWSVIARDAFNGTILWRRAIKRWHTHLWPLKSGPAQLPRRLVAVGDRVYVTLDLRGPVTALDAATGATVRKYEGTSGCEEILVSGDTLFALVDDRPDSAKFDGLKWIRRGYSQKVWDGAKRHIVAIRANGGQVLWREQHVVLPATLAVDEARVFFHNGKSVVGLDRRTGKKLWSSKPVPRVAAILGFFVPTLVVYDGVVLFSGGETAGKQTGSWYRKGKDTLTALDANTGGILWKAHHPPSGYRSPEDLLVASGLVWTGETTSGRAEGLFTGRDPKTGEVKVEFKPDLDTYWFHHRCYRGKATDKYLLMSRTGTEFVDLEAKKWIQHHWFRGACLYGVMPANGMIYAPPHPCACYLEAKLFGFNALAAAPRRRRPAVSTADRLVKGPAYHATITAAGTADDDWPTFRHDGARSGATSSAVPAQLGARWETELGGRLSSLVIAGGRVFVASTETHVVHALDSSTGKRLWDFTAGGRVDSPPTVFEGRVLFGSADGWVYCLRANDGALVWRFLAAPRDERLMSFEQLESVWPTNGSVLVQNGVAYTVAGRSMFLDGGLRLYRLDPRTGRMLSETVLSDRERETGKDLHEYVSWLNLPTTLPDILSSDGRFVYMRSQPFRLDGTRPPLKKPARGTDADAGAPPPAHDVGLAHLFCPTGFLDDSWWHRSYWLYGSTFISGWQGYYRAGKAAPAGRILSFDDTKVYGFGRLPKYFRWTVPIEHHLFAADRLSSTIDNPLSRENRRRSRARPVRETRVRVATSASLRPAGKALTVAAWVRAEAPNGVILALGGGASGYALLVKNGRPQFSVRIGQKVATVVGPTTITGDWKHVTGILLADDKTLRLCVDGRPVATSASHGRLAANPQESLEIGADESSQVVAAGAGAFRGAIDEVRIYHRALAINEVQRLADPTPAAGAPADGLVLWHRFEGGAAVDSSKHGNNGTVTGATRVAGRVGDALQFSGGDRNAANRYAVNHYWTKELSILARAMVLADRTIFVAGPPDLIDEPRTFQRIERPEVGPSLLEQGAAIEGKRGATLFGVSADDGTQIATYDLESPPVFDGLAAANGRLFLARMDGKVLCLAGKEPDER